MSDKAIARLAKLLNKTVAEVRKLDINDAMNELAADLGIKPPREKRIRPEPENVTFSFTPSGYIGSGKVMVS